MVALVCAERQIVRCFELRVGACALNERCEVLRFPVVVRGVDSLGTDDAVERAPRVGRVTTWQSQLFERWALLVALKVQRAPRDNRSSLCRCQLHRFSLCTLCGCFLVFASEDQQNHKRQRPHCSTSCMCTVANRAVPGYLVSSLQRSPVTTTSPGIETVGSFTTDTRTVSSVFALRTLTADPPTISYKDTEKTAVDRGPHKSPSRSVGMYGGSFAWNVDPAVPAHDSVCEISRHVHCAVCTRSAGIPYVSVPTTRTVPGADSEASAQNPRGCPQAVSRHGNKHRASAMVRMRAKASTACR